MKKLLFAILPLAYLLSGCHPDKCTGCKSIEVCMYNRCQCGEFGEGDTCTPLRNKFIGTYIGDLYLNGANPQADTITFAVKANTPINYLYALGKNFGIYIRFSRQVNYFTDVTTSKQVDSGVGLLSDDGKTLTLTYLPVLNSAVIDSTNEYTFIGTKQ